MKSTIPPTPLNLFLLVYFYTLEQDLNNSENELKHVKFQSEEANTDEYLKRYFQAYILENNDLSKTSLKTISFIIDSHTFAFDIGVLLPFKITSVFLPEQLSKEQKKQIGEAKTSIYTNPDLFLEISNGKNTFFESVELKSTKTNHIPGSSVQQVSPFEWVIFVKRNKDNIRISTGHYINSITEKLPFPDRSPRPQIGFKTLVDWNKKYRTVKDGMLLIENKSQLNEQKIKLLKDWQDFLADEWLEIVKADTTKKTEKWFNNAIRKFALKFLNYTEELDEDAKTALKNKLMSLIK